TSCWSRHRRIRPTPWSRCCTAPWTRSVPPGRRARPCGSWQMFAWSTGGPRPRSDTIGPMSGSVGVAFVLGGGGVLGASEVGMLQALHERRVRADLVVGTSVGAINGAMHAAFPEESAQLALLWLSMSG